MTLADLREYVWRRLPVRKHLVGRQAMDDVVTLIVENWQGDYMAAAATDAERAVVCGAIVADVKRAHQWQSGQEPGNYVFFWAIILQALVAVAVQKIIEWWLQRRSHRLLIEGWQRELTR